ncbi:MAG: hypothetical protein Q8L74_10105 [Nitrospirota bacterium]|nr:hypothetical protein [Nitrospirota bacterium]
MNKSKKNAAALLALVAVSMASNAFALAPTAGDVTAITTVGTDLLLWASPVIGIALVILGYKRVTRIVK